MKYIILAFAMLGSIGWHMLQSNNSEHKQLTKIQIHGKVQSLQGSMVLKIEDNYLNLNAYDRFSFIAHTPSKELLTMRVVDQPKDQYCDVLKSNPTKNTIRLNIFCQVITNTVIKDDVIVSL